LIRTLLRRCNTSIIANQDNSQQSSSNQITPSPYDISNIPSSLDPLFNLGSVIGSDLGNIASGSGSSRSCSTNLQPMMPQVIGQIPPPGW